MKKFMVIMLVMVISQFSCGSKEAPAVKAKPAPFSGTVITIDNGGGYTFIEIKGASGTFWATTRPIQVKKGDAVQLIHPMKMEKFPVKSLNRTFAVIYFADDVLVNGKGHMKNGSKMMGMGNITKSPHGAESGQATNNVAENPHGAGSGQAMGNANQLSKSHMGGDTKMDASGVKPVGGSIALGELLHHPEKYSGKTVKVHALVTKYLPMIMKKNWLHLKDASTGAGHLVVTTDEKFKVGDTVILYGKVEVKKDFGFGYKYDVLLTHAKSGK